MNISQKALFMAAWGVAFFVSVGLGEDTVRTISLKEAKERVLSSDQSLRNAYLEIKKAELQPWSALSKYGPRVTGSLGYSNTEVSGSGRRDTTSAGITYQQPLFDMTFFSAYQLGKLSEEVSKLNRKFLERDVILGLIKAYYDVLKQGKLVSLDKEILDVSQKQLELTQERFRVGDLSSLDVTRAQLDVENVKNQLVTDESNSTLSKNTLANILNLDERKNFEVEEPPVEEEKNEDFEVILARAYQQREDYAAGKLAIDQSLEEKNRVLAEYAPQVNGQLRQQWSDTDGNSSSPWDASITLQMPFFEGGQREVDLKNADYEIEQSRILQETLGKNIQQEVKEAWVQVNMLRQKLSNLSIAAETAEQTYAQTKAQYEAGSSTSLDVSAALRDLNQAKTNFIVAKYDYWTALNTLERATGSLSILAKE